MAFGDGSHAAEFWMVRIAPKIGDSARMWRELARPVTLFDLASPRDFLREEIGEFFRKKRARQDSNLRPPA
jgi:hypothetical protein